MERIRTIWNNFFKNYNTFRNNQYLLFNAQYYVQSIYYFLMIFVNNNELSLKRCMRDVPILTTWLRKKRWYQIYLKTRYSCIIFGYPSRCWIIDFTLIRTPPNLEISSISPCTVPWTHHKPIRHVFFDSPSDALYGMAS